MFPQIVERLSLPYFLEFPKESTSSTRDLGKYICISTFFAIVLLIDWRLSEVFDPRMLTFQALYSLPYELTVQWLLSGYCNQCIEPPTLGKWYQNLCGRLCAYMYRQNDCSAETSLHHRSHSRLQSHLAMSAGWLPFSTMLVRSPIAMLQSTSVMSRSLLLPCSSIHLRSLSWQKVTPLIISSTRSMNSVVRRSSRGKRPCRGPLNCRLRC